VSYEKHGKKMLKHKAVRSERDDLLPEYVLARSIIERRLKKKMTQLDVAKKTGMPQSSVARIEGLTHGLPRLSTLKKIALALDAELIIRLKAKKTA
jgi:transcriptional regulator with XRE-family HTH domain